jgi:hypothetical protein
MGKWIGLKRDGGIVKRKVVGRKVVGRKVVGGETKVLQVEYRSGSAHPPHPTI